MIRRLSSGYLMIFIYFTWTDRALRSKWSLNCQRQRVPSLNRVQFFSVFFDWNSRWFLFTFSLNSGIGFSNLDHISFLNVLLQSTLQVPYCSLSNICIFCLQVADYWFLVLFLRVSRSRFAIHGSRLKTSLARQPSQNSMHHGKTKLIFHSRVR